MPDADEDLTMTPDEKRQRFIRLLREAHGHAMGAQELCPDPEMQEILATLISRMAALETWASKELSPVVMPPLEEISVTGPRPKHPALTCGAGNGAAGAVDTPLSAAPPTITAESKEKP